MHEDLLRSVTPKIAQRLEQIVAAQRLPGLAAGIVVDQSLAWFQGFGWADVATKRPPDENTLFRVASITKTLTAGCILQLRDAGKLSLDDPLVRHIPEFKGVKPRGGSVEGVTLRRLLSHHAGIETEAPLPCWDALEFPTREELLKVLPRMEVVIPQDSAFKYSNVAFGLLGEVVSRLSGQPYFETLKAGILDPLGMSSSVFEITADLRRRFATGYVPSPYADRWEPAPYVKLNGIGACGQLHSSPHDLARWISLQFRTDNGGKVLCGQTLEEMHRPQYLEPDWSIGYCLGWRAVRAGNRVYHGHGGGIHGFASQISFSKVHRVGAICLTNVWPHPGMLPTANEVLDALVTAIEAVPAAPRPANAETPRELEPLLGTYLANPGVPLAVVYRNGALRFEKSPMSDYMLHVPAVLKADVEGGPLDFRVTQGRGAGEKVNFELDGSGGARFSLGGFVYRKLVAK